MTTSSGAAERTDWAELFFDAWYDELAAGEAVGRDDPATWRREELRAECERGSSEEVVHWLLALDGTEPVGSAELRMTLRDNTQVAHLTLAVGPRHRRRGVATLLLERALDVAEAAGRTRLRVEVDRPVGTDPGRWPGVCVARRWALTAGQEVARRQLVLPVAADHLDRLEAAVGAHADGYSVSAFAGAIPEADLDGVARLVARMSTDAPSGDLEVEPEVWDGERVREGEALRAVQGRRQWLALARADDGALVGYTMLLHSEHEPGRLLQWDTLVLREHRGHRLGLLLKLACLRAAVADVPQAQRVTTWNAISNIPMITVNEALGFTWDETTQELEQEITLVRAALRH
ncbi:MAG: GNAT family N-acetyltransferase [Janthinobacterium lividum]